MSKINSREIFDGFRRKVLVHGAQIDLVGLPAIARYLGYTERNFYEKIKKINFDYWQLKDLFHRLHFTDQEIAELLK